VGVVLSDGRELRSRSVVITTGTFLRGVLMMGKDRYAGGRHLRDSERVEPPSTGLAKTLERFSFPLGRLKTGTPPRLDGNTIDWEQLDIQPSEMMLPFSHVRQMSGEDLPNACRPIDCYKTRTNERTHELVSRYEHLLPEYDAMEGKGNGPRYCPSIHKKVERFPERTSHNCFLEPEGLNTHIVYPNGMSGPYPEHVQLEIMRTMQGLEKVEIVRPGYDVEYDFVNPKNILKHTLESKPLQGLFLAGQICGTTGYEEAAAQGIVAGANAGINAVAAARGEVPKPFVVGRDEGYVGVLIDDLVTKGTKEPYRMFTSRSEYRISLRADNADFRLTPKAIEAGLITDPERITAFRARESIVHANIDRLKNYELFVKDWARRGNSQTMGGDNMHKKLGQKKTAAEVLRMPHVTLEEVEDIMCEDENFRPSPASVYDTVEASIKYKHYVTRQEKDMDVWRKAQGLRIPGDIVYDHALFPALSGEELDKLSTQRPTSFAEASEISGITQQSLVYLYHHVKKRGRSRDRMRTKALQ